MKADNDGHVATIVETRRRKKAGQTLPCFLQSTTHTDVTVELDTATARPDHVPQHLRSRHAIENGHGPQDCCRGESSGLRHMTDNQDMTNPLLSADPLPLGGGSNVHLEILNGTDEALDAGDFMAGGRSPLSRQY